MPHITLGVLRRLLDYQLYQEVRQQIASLPRTPAHRVLEILALFHLGQRQHAEQLFAELWHEAHPLDLDTVSDIAAIQLLRGEYSLAHNLLRSVLEFQPNHAVALARLAECLRMQGDILEAERLLGESLSLKPERLITWRQAIALSLQCQSYERAQRYLNDARQHLATVEVEMPPVAALYYRSALRMLQIELWLDEGKVAETEHWLDDVDDVGDEAQSVYWRSQVAMLLAHRDEHDRAEDVLRLGLQRYPDNLELILKLAELISVQGRNHQACQLLRRAVKLEPDQASYWARLAEALLLLHPGKAKAAAEQALALSASYDTDATFNPVWAQAKLILAEVASQSGDVVQAECSYQEVLAALPQHVAALKAYGRHKMAQGQMDDAVLLFEQVKAHDFAAGMAALISARSYPQDKEALSKLEAAASQHTLEGSVRSGLLFQSSAAWEKLGDYEKAFSSVDRANRIVRQGLRYCPKAHRNRCAAIRYAFNRALFEHFPGYGSPSSMPVFVVGMPRSGTTLVEQIVSGHSRIYGAGELSLIPARIQGMERWERHVGSGRSYPECTDDLTVEVVAAIADGVLGDLREMLQQNKPEAAYVVDKLPHNFENIGLIKLLFPNAKIISVRRDSRDIAISNYFTDYQAKHGGMGFAYDLQWIGEQLADHNLLMHHWHQVFPGEILEINYEDVVEDLEGSARQLLEYLGVEWEPQVLQFNTLKRPVKTASVWQVRQPIYKTSKAKWKRYEAHLGPLIAGTNARITWDPIEMVTLPEPGLLTQGTALFQRQQYDDAEHCLKKLLHHVPEHAAACYLLGLVYLNKGYMAEGIEQLERALQRCPWQREWRDNLIRAYDAMGAHDKAQTLKQAHRDGQNEKELDVELDFYGATTSAHSLSIQY